VLPARHRLRTAADFSATVRGAGGARSGGRLLVVHGRYAGPSTADDRPDDRPVDHPVRVGFVVSKAVGGAVTRNRTKRVLRHLAAARLSRIPAGCDVVVRANPAAADATSTELAAELDRSLDSVLRRLPTPAPVAAAVPS
jgi:ribonuclease P protein component